jgi:ribosomal protein S18 acetylase RimI-like enzyme
MAMSTEAGEDLLIRNATKDDLPRVLEIFRQAFRLDASSESELLGFLEQRHVSFIVAQIGDEVVAFTLAYVRDGCPHLLATAVAPEFRTRRGIGTKMIRQHFSNFRKWGYSEIDTFVRCTNSISIGMVAKLGFKHVRTMRNFYDTPKGSTRLYVRSLLDDGKVSIRGPNLRDRAKDVWGRVFEPRLNRGLQVAWFDRWNRALDNALRELPEMEGCPHELFRMIVQNPSSTRKRTALVMEGDGPLAVVGLREKGQCWLPAMQGIIPEAIAPAREGYLFPALKALGVDVRIAGSPTPPPMSLRARNAISVPVFKVDCQGDFEDYWRRSQYLRNVKVARSRTEAFTFEVDRPGSAALIIAQWAEKWQDHPEQQTIIASDLIVAADYWQQRNRWHSFLVLDGDVPAAGVTGPVHGNNLVYTINFRDNRYDRHHVGTRIIDLIVQWAAEHGFAKFDLGGWYSYKAKCGPQDGEQWDFRICPLRQHLREQAVWKARAVPEKLMAPFGRHPMPSGARDDGEQGVGGKQPQEASEAGSGNPGPVHSATADARTGRDE